MTHCIKKQTALLLIALMTVSSLSACGSSEQSDVDDTTAVGADSSAVTSDNLNQGYPALENKDFNGAKFNMLIRTEYDYEFMIEEETADPVDDAVFKRNRSIEDRYNVELNFIDMVGAWGSHMDFVNAIHNSVLAGDGAYDAVAGYQAVMPYNIANGDFVNLYDLKHIELNAPWWNQVGVEALTQNGKCFMVGGDIAVSFLESIQCLFFNKQIAIDYKIPDLYELVRSDEWTHDKFMEVTKGLYQDVNNNNTRDEEDSYGLVARGFGLRSYLVAYDTPTVKDGEIVWMTEHTVDVVEKLVDAFAVDNWYTQKEVDVFRQSQALFLISGLGSAKNMRDMPDDFGFLPYPKFDENQESYITTTANLCSMMCVPITAKDADDSAFILEAMCRESSDTVATAFYDVALQSKYARDEQSLEMIQLIRSSLSFDFGWINSQIVGITGQQYETMIKNSNKNFSSWYESKKTEFETKLASYLECYR